MALTQINTRSLSGTLTTSQYPIASNDLPAGTILQTIIHSPATTAEARRDPPGRAETRPPHDPWDRTPDTLGTSP